MHNQNTSLHLRGVFKHWCGHGIITVDITILSCNDIIIYHSCHHMFKSHYDIIR